MHRTGVVVLSVLTILGGTACQDPPRTLTAEQRERAAEAAELRAVARERDRADNLRQRDVGAARRQQRAAEPPRPPRNPAIVTADTWADGPWPLTVDGGILTCTPVAGVEAVYITTTDDGRMWPLNGAGRAHHGRWGAEPATEPIWRENPRIPGSRVNIGPLIDRARSLC